MAGILGAMYKLILVFLGFAGVFARNHSQVHNYTVGIFLRNEGTTWSSLEKLAREISDPRSASYGHYLSQEQLAQRVGIPTSDAEEVATSLHQALAQAALQSPGSLVTSLEAPHIVSHRDAVLMTVPDFFATYDLGQGLTENLSSAWPRSVHMLVTPPMPDDLCSGRREKDCRKPCKWHQHREHHNATKQQAANHQPSNQPSNQQPANHQAARNHSECSGTCAGGFAGWICWREKLLGVRSEAQWHCFEPAEFKGVKPENSSNATVTMEATAKRRRRGVQVFDVLSNKTTSKRRKFHAVGRSGGFGLLTRQNESFHRCQSFEVTFRQDELLQNRLLKSEDFVKHGDLHSTAVKSLKNLRHVRDMFLCCNPGSAAVAPLGQVGCHCEATNDTNESAAWGLDRRLGRDCEKVWSFGPSGAVLPRGAQSLEALYRDLEVLPEAGEMGSQAVAQFNDEAFLQEDVTHLHRAYGLPVAKEVHVHGVRGKKDNSDTGGEGSLDLQTITALAPSAPTTWWGVDPWVIDGFMLGYTVGVNDHAAPPLVHSISWGDAEALYPAAFVQRLDYELMKLTLRGITVIVASGDNGNSAVGSECDFIADVVGTSEWVTSVGATMPSLDSKPYCQQEAFRQQLGDCEELGQVTCSSAQGALITSSGYFSVYRPRPKYQNAAVETFLRTSSCEPFPACAVHNQTPVGRNELEGLKSPCQHISKSGCSLSNLVKDSRAAPDVALPGQSYPVLVNHSVFGFDGTSASAPALAALISRLNGLQRQRGQPPLGLLNPWFYQVHSEHPQAFLDVVVGDTASTESRLCPFGFLAAPGWDPATGLGVPRYARLRELLPKMNNASCNAASPGPSALLERIDVAWHVPSIAAVAVFSLAGAFVAKRALSSRRTDARWELLKLPFLREPEL